jgi:hypothetical protein
MRPLVLSDVELKDQVGVRVPHGRVLSHLENPIFRRLEFEIPILCLALEIPFLLFLLYL